MAFATFANLTATSKQLVGYMKLFPSSRQAVIKFCGSFNNDKGKKRVFMCLKAPPLPYLLFTVVLSLQENPRKGSLRPMFA